MKVFVGIDETEKFKSNWPASGLPEYLAILFDYAENGDLVDIVAIVDGKPADSSQFDGPALLALSQDAQHGKIGQPALDLRKYSGREGIGFFREMTDQEARSLRSGQHIWFRSVQGDARRAKVNGQPKTWKTRPAEWEVPIKYGMYECARFNQNERGRLLVELS